MQHRSALILDLQLHESVIKGKLMECSKCIQMVDTIQKVIQ